LLVQWGMPHKRSSANILKIRDEAPFIPRPKEAWVFWRTGDKISKI
jgi:hypothetical protein